MSRWVAGTVLNGGQGNSRCRPETAERIRAAADRLGYRPNLAARLLSGKPTGLFGLLAGGAADPPAVKLAHRLGLELDRQGIQAIHVSVFGGGKKTENGFSNRIDEFAHRGVDGVFCIVPSWQAGNRQALVDRFPLTVFYGDPRIPAAAYVAADHRAIGRLPVEHLTATGRQRIGLALMTLTRPNHLQRLAGHIEALSAAGLDDGEPAIFDTSQHGQVFPVYDSHTLQWNYPTEIVDRCVDSLVIDRRVDAVVAHDDFFAAVLLRRLRLRGIRVPDDVAVVGYCNHTLADWTDPPLTTIDPGHDEAARTMVEMSRQLSLGKADVFPEPVIVPPTLIRRQSA